jgi:hypothetical protein
MFKKKDHAMLEEAYNKVLMNEIHAEFPPDENSEHGDENSYINHHIDDIKHAMEMGDIETAKSLIEVLNAKVNGGSNSSSDDDVDFEDEEPQSTGGNEGTGEYISNKDRSAQHKSDFLINRMNLKPGKDF